MSDYEEVRTIWRYSLPAQQAGVITIKMPLNSEIVNVGWSLDHNCPSVWALVDPDMMLFKRLLLLAHTGSEFDREYRTYYGMYQDPHSKLVYHLLGR